MSLAEHQARLVASIGEDASAAEAACLMQETGSGFLVVLSGSLPVGLITDRDLALRVACEDLDPIATSVGEVTSRPLIWVAPNAPYAEVLQCLRMHGIRRLPVLDGGRLAGIVQMDDLLIALAGELGDLAECLRREVVMSPADGSPVGAPRFHERKGRIGWRPHLRWQV